MNLDEIIREALLKNQERIDNLLLSEQDDIDEYLNKIEDILTEAKLRQLPEREDNGVRNSDFI